MGVLRRRALLLAALALPALAACGGNSAPEPMPSPAERFESVVASYEAGNYGRAIRSLKEFLLRHPLHEHADSAQYLLASAYLEDGQLELAAEEFRQFANTRPGSRLADDAQLGACRALWRKSPSVPRSQEDTRRAIQECQRLIEFFPESPLVSDAREIIDRAKNKLAEKNYRIARYYFEDGFYESANIYLEMVVEDYPDSPVVPEALATLYRSYRELGFESEAKSVRQRLLTEYPDSPQAERLRGPGESASGG